MTSDLVRSKSHARSLVLGGTGMVGRHIVRQLILSGDKPFALSRRAQQSQNVEWLRGDLAQMATLPPCEKVFCTVHVQLLADALSKWATPALQRIVAFTSTSILTKASSEIAEERQSVSRLADGEQALIAVCTRLGISWTILRPTLIYDEGRDQNVTRLAGLIRRFGVLPLFGGGTGLRQPVHAEDLAVGALAAAKSSAAANKIYTLAGPDVITYREMVGRIYDGLQKPRRTVSVPGWIWRTAFLGLQPFLPDANVAMGARMVQDMDFDISKAQADFGWDPREFRPRFVS